MDCLTKCLISEEDYVREENISRVSLFNTLGHILCNFSDKSEDVRLGIMSRPDVLASFAKALQIITDVNIIYTFPFIC